ncbi:uncharacterized protein LOC111128472 isoform X1 [Crassostrea virginica]
MKNSYNLQERSSERNPDLSSFKVRNHLSINDNRTPLIKMSEVEDTDVITATETLKGDTTDRHNDSLITDLDDVSLLCDNEVEEATGNHQGSSDDNRQADGHGVTDLDTGITDLGEVERARVNDKDGGQVIFTTMDDLETGKADKMENGQITASKDEREVITDIDMEAVKGYILKIVTRAQEIVQDESKETAKKKRNQTKPWTQRLAEILCFRRK